MRIASFPAAPTLAALVLSLSAAAAPASALPLTGEGVWRNPKDSVHIQLRACGQEICGYVVYASEKAEADAREGGTPKLMGLQLLRGFKLDDKGVGHGKVFVPDMNATFSGSAELIDARTLRAKGCLLGNLLCKAQLWTRVETPGT